MITKNMVNRLQLRTKEIFGVEAKAVGSQTDGSAKSVKATINKSVAISDLIKLDSEIPYKGSIRRSGKGLTLTYN